MKVVGQGLNRVDAYGKVTGEAKYSADLEPRDILHGKVIHSTIANGLVKSFDLTEALKVPGVVKILTCFDAPDCQFPTAGHPWSVEAKHQDICDRRVLNQRVRLYGDDIAAVVAENEVAAAQAARLVKVEYEEYEPIVTVKAAMAPEATPLHPDIRKDNVIVHSHMTMGPKDFTFEDGLKQAKEKYKEEDLVEIKEELTQSGYIRRKGGTKKAKITSRPFHYLSSDGFHIYVGKNNFQNDELTFKFATGNDWWFHAKGIPGSHVVVKTEGKELPDRTFEEAGRLAAYYSKGREQEKVEIDYVQKKQVKKPAGAKPGFVVYYTNYSLMIDSDISGIEKISD